MTRYSAILVVALLLSGCDQTSPPRKDIRDDVRAGSIVKSCKNGDVVGKGGLSGRLLLITPAGVLSDGRVSYVALGVTAKEICE